MALDLTIVGRVCLQQSPSLSAAARFADASIDIVMIDADHSAEAVLYDLCAWHRKVKRGGILMGHDLTPLSGVHHAVWWFAAALSLPMPDIVERSHSIWMYRDWQPMKLRC